MPGGFKVHGIYGRVVQDGRSLIANDPSSHPDRIGLPEGHPSLKAFLGVPLTYRGKVVGMIGLGNKDGGYAEDDMLAVEEIAPYLIGKDPRQVAHHWQAMYRQEFYRGGVVLTSAISAVDIAMWDIKGKALGVPVYELLGGPTRDGIHIYYAPDSPNDAVAHVKEMGINRPNMVKKLGYCSPPLDGLWMRAPYLHNGSVPTLRDLLTIPVARPSVFWRGYDVYDYQNVGFVSQGAEAEREGFRAFFKFCAEHTGCYAIVRQAEFVDIEFAAGQSVGQAEIRWETVIADASAILRVLAKALLSRYTVGSGVESPRRPPEIMPWLSRRKSDLKRDEYASPL